MCFFGGSSSTPAAPPLPPPIPAPIDTTVANPQAEASRQSVAVRAAQAQGLGSTILTSPLGVTTPAQTSKPTLLGITQ